MDRAAALRARGEELFVLAQAVVDYAPPAAFTRSLAEELGSDSVAIHGYAPDPGTPELREVLAGYIARSFGFEADPERELLVTPGANHAAYTVFSALLEPGDEALLVSPWYFNHEMSVRLLGGRVRWVTARASEEFVPSVADILAAWTPAQTYQEIHYGEGHPLSPASLDALRGRTLTVSSFSKSCALAGWRLGFLAGPAEFIEQALKIQDSSVICAPHAAQRALAKVLGDSDALDAYLAEKRSLLRVRRDALLEPLISDSRLAIHTPGGACFAFVGLPEGVDAEAFAWELLEKRRVVVVPGVHFGEDWTRYIRLSFGSGSETYLREAAGRVNSFLDELRA
jgi:aminotransferase